jgi:2-polyprenyl-3-methyl-5-hydroxy-6-metoxy-1,4-benzoquinol methylase
MAAATDRTTAAVSWGSWGPKDRTQDQTREYLGYGSPMKLPQSRYADDERAEVQLLVPEGFSSFLDVGCASGGFGRGLRRRFPDARIVGVEAVGTSAAEARANGYDLVVDGYFPEALTGEEKFDCILFNDVLEHMIDPWSAVAASREMLKPGGHIVSSIPNIRYFPVLIDLLRRDRWDYVDWGVLDRTHVRFFTRSTIQEMFTEAGFVVERTEGINSAFNLAKWKRFRRLSGRLGGTEWMQFVVVARLP